MKLKQRNQGLLERFVHILKADTEPTKASTVMVCLLAAVGLYLRSKSDRSGDVANSIALTGAFPAGFPNAWKAMDNSYVAIPDVDAFKAMHAAMTAQGTINFGHSQDLKTALAAATTVEQIDAIVW